MFAIDFGNGLKVDGEVKAGIAVETADDGDEDTAYDTTVRGYNNGAEKDLCTRLTAAYSADWGGAKIRFESAGFSGDSASPFYAKYAYGWANLLDSKIVLSGGVIGDDLWGLGKLGANVFDPSLDGITGFRAEFKFVDGLSFGFGLPVNTKTTIDHAAGGWVVGGLYKSSFISAAAGLKFNPGTDDVAAGEPTYSVQFDKSDPTNISKATVKTTPGSARVPGNDFYIDAILGVEVNPIDALKVVLDTDFDTRKFEDHAKIGSSRIGLKGEYTAGPLTAHLQGDARIQNEKYADLLEDIGKAEADSRLKAVAAGFQVTNKTSRGEAKTPTDHAKIYYADYVPVGNPGDLSLAFRIGADYKVNDTIGVYLQIGSENILWFKGDVDLKKSGEYVAEEEAKVDPNYDAMWKYQMPGAGLYAKLGGKITFGTSSIEIFDKINRIGAGDLEKQNATDKTKYDSYSPITNQFQVDFNWVF